MAVELATLQVNVNGAQAARDVDTLNRSLDRTAVAGARVERTVTTASRAIGASGAQLQAASRQAMNFATTLATTGTISAKSARDVAASALTLGSAFGPGSVAVLAVAGFASHFIGEMGKVREELARVERDWRETLDKLVNAGNNAQLRKMAQDLFLGTPAGNFEDGIQASERRIADLKRRAEELGAIGQLGLVFNPTTLRAEEANLATLRTRFLELQRLITDPRNALRTFGGLPAVTTTADAPGAGPRDERAAWEESRRRAEQRERWELDAIARANNLAAARLRAEMPGLRLPGASSLTFGGLSTSITGGVQQLPEGMRVRPGLTVAQGQAVAAAREAIERREAMRLVNEQIAQNFRENLQRATGATLTEFIVTGRASVRDVFSTFKQIGASTIGETLSAQLSRITGNLGLSGSLVAGGALSFLGTVAERFFGASERQAAAAEALERAATDRRSTFAQIAQDARRFGLDPSLSPEERARQQAQRTAAGFADDLLNTIGDRSLSTAARRAFNAARSELGSIDFDELDRLRELLRGFAFPADLELLERIQRAYRDNLNAQEQLAALATADRLKAFGSSLSLSQFSPLSPTAQLREARAQYQSLLTRALGGDANAAEQFQTSAQSLLGLSRSVNASGGRFVADFNTVSQDTARLEALFRDRATVAEETRNAVQDTASNTARTNEVLAATSTLLAERLDAVVDRLDTIERLTRENAI